jgi:GWxTD domain-containing protein
MTGFGRPRDAAAGAGATALDSLAALPEAQLDSMYAPLIYLMAPEERGVYPGLTVDGKRTFLRQFWKRRDPTPGTAANEAEAQFYRTVAEANREFREGGAGEVPGWRTDRGRVYIRNGPPVEVLDRSQAGSARPYVVWKYTAPKLHRYVFLDATSVGHYELIWTDDRREPSRPDWQWLLGPEATADVQQF